MASRFHFMQFCDVPAAIPPAMDEILVEAAGERFLPGAGGVDPSTTTTRPGP